MEWPIGITVLAFAFVLYTYRDSKRDGSWDLAAPLVLMFYGGMATIVSLIAWLVWALVT